MPLNLRSTLRTGILWPILDNMWLPRLHNKRYNLEDVYIIFSEASGGSTWLTEMINQNLNAFICWEPLHPKRGFVKTNPPTPRLSWNGAIRNELTQQLSRIFTGQAISSWTVSKNKNALSRSSQNYPKLLVKFVRGNRLLSGIDSVVELKNKPVVLLRHPTATVLSQLRRFNVKMVDYYQMGYLNNDPAFTPHKDFFNALETALEKEFALYCFNNHTVLTSFDSLPYIFVFYEDLILYPEEKINEIFGTWGLVWDKQSIQSQKASSEGTEGRSFIYPQEQLKKWTTKLTEVEKEKLQHILDHFKIRIYSMYSLLPVK